MGFGTVAGIAATIAKILFVLFGDPVHNLAVYRTQGSVYIA